MGGGGFVCSQTHYFWEKSLAAFYGDSISGELKKKTSVV